MRRTTKRQKKQLAAKYKILQMIDDLITVENNDDKREMIRSIKKEFMNNYGDYASFYKEER